MGDLQDPIDGGTEPYKAIFFGDIPWKLGLIYGRYLQFRILEWPLNQGENHASTARNLWSKQQDTAVHHKNLAQIAAKKNTKKGSIDYEYQF